MEDFVGLVAVVLIFGSIPAIIIFFVAKRHKEKMELINKGVNIPIHSQTAYLESGSKPLLWGLILIAVGLAFIIGGFVVSRNVDRDMITFGTFFLFGGIATLAYWKLTKKERDSARALNEEYMKKLIESMDKTIDQE